MAWKLSIWFGHSDRADPALVEEVVNQAAGNARAQEVLADGYTVVIGDINHHFPAGAVTHVKLEEITEPEE